jgi:tetratricopeptide (TPR) repeat protein
MAEGNRRGGARPSGRNGSTAGRGKPPAGRGGPKAKRGPGAKGTGGPPRRGGGRSSAPKPVRDDGRRGPKEWGAVGRRGAGEVRTPRPDTASDEWRKAVQRSRDGEDGGRGPSVDEWVEETIEDDVDLGGEAPRRGPERVEVDLSDDDRRKLARDTGRKAKDNEQRLKDAAKAFRGDRFEDARRILSNLAELAPSVPAVRELYGLTLYRLRRWKLAAAELEAFAELTHSTEQHPVLADCYRALKQPKRVAELWDELREASPSAELVTEGRIVMAGAMADRGDVNGAIKLLGQSGWKLPRQPREHHLRRAYALADLFERAGEVGKARDLFTRIQRADPRFGDVGRRLKAL